MSLLLAANNQATRRNEIKSYLQLGSSSNRYAPRLPQQEPKSSTKQLVPNLLKTGFAQKGLPSSIRDLCPPALLLLLEGRGRKEEKREKFYIYSDVTHLFRFGTVALPVAISHKVSLKPKLCASATLIQKTSKNEPKRGPKNGTARQLGGGTEEGHFRGPVFGTVRRYQK